MSTSGAGEVTIPEYAVRILRALGDAAMLVAASGTILAVNRAAREALGIAAERPIDCELGRLTDGSPSKLTDTLRTWSRTTDATPGSFAAKTAAGVVTFNAKGALVVPADGEAPAVVFVRFWPRADANPFVLLNQKLTELNDEVARRVHVEEALRRSELALRERATEAEALNRAKDEFLATVSHELRTPLNAILGWSSLLRDRVIEPDVAKALEVVYRNARAQAKLIDDILDVSRIITGKLLLESKPSDLADIVEEAVEVVRPSAAAKQIEIGLGRPPGGCLLVGDPDRLRQVVWNLLSNAVKFTPPGGGIRVSLERCGAHLRLVVSDTGAGIEPSFLPFVFDRFKQADSSTTRRVGGLGLGLALVRHIVELHGGVVAASSDGAGTGATFTVTLPVAPAQAPVSIPRDRGSVATLDAKPADGAVLEGVRVLVVDDEPDARELLSAVLTRAGADVETAGSATAAFEALPRVRPHVLVSDIGMPDEDGYSLIRRIRQLESHGGGVIPSIALTAYTRAEDRTRALASGFTTHIGKPVNPKDLVAAVSNLAVFGRRA